MQQTQKPPTFAERGRLGAAKRWSDPANRTRIYLYDLSPAQRRLVLDFVAAIRQTAGTRPRRASHE
jgi:hypothetical protein